MLQTLGNAQPHSLPNNEPGFNYNTPNTQISEEDLKWKEKLSITENEKLSYKLSLILSDGFLFSYTCITSHIVLKNDEKGCNNRALNRGLTYPTKGEIS